MRLAGVVFAILLIAACPPRRARIAYSPPPCPAPVVPVMPTPVPPAPIPSAKAIDPALELLLTEWEKKIESATNFRAEISLKRTDAVFKKERAYTGTVLMMRPNFAVLRLDNAGDPSKTDYEAYVYDGKTLFAYSGVQKMVTEITLPLKWPYNLLWTGEYPVLDLLTGMKAAEMKERFDISLFKTDEHYLYLDIKPRLSKDEREFKHVRLALYGPGEATAKFAYLPAQMYILKPSGDTEIWKFTNPQVNLPGVTPGSFAFVPVKGFELKKAGRPPEEGEGGEPDKP